MIERTELDQFGGVADQLSEVRRPGYVQEDVGGSREQAGVWRVRRGHESTGLAQAAAAIQEIAGFEREDGTLAYVLGTNAKLYGETA